MQNGFFMATPVVVFVAAVVAAVCSMIHDFVGEENGEGKRWNGKREEGEGI